MSWVLVTAPAALFDVAEAKAFLRVDSDDDNALIESLISAATRVCENFTNRNFVTQTWDKWLDFFPMRKATRDDWWDGVQDGPISGLNYAAGFIELERVPLQSITHIKTFSPDDTESTFSASNYLVDGKSIPARVALNEAAVWPTNLRRYNAVQVRAAVGYGAAAAVPKDIVNAVKFQLATMYENRNVCDDCDLNGTAKLLLKPYVVMRGSYAKVRRSW